MEQYLAKSNVVMSIWNLVKFKLDPEIQNRSQKKGCVRNCPYVDWKHTEAEELSNRHKDFQIHSKD